MDNVIKFLQEKLTNNKYLLACSTGPDSMCLLDLCIKAGLKDNLSIAFINHGLRVQADTEEEYITSFCKDNNIPLYKTKLSLPSTNVEAVARLERYNFFKKVMKENNINILLTAHNADDNLETILMRLLKKSSLNGYSGITSYSKLDEFDVYRPLIEYSKDDIMEYNNKNNVKYFIDHTNLENNYTRSRFRNTITGLLKQENPNWEEAVTHYSNTLTAANRLLFKTLNDFYNNYVKFIDNDIYINISDFIKLDTFIGKEVIFDLLLSAKLSVSEVDNIYNLIINNTDHYVYKINDIYTLIKEYGTIIITTKKIDNKEFNIVVDKCGTYELLDGDKLTVDSNIVYLSSNNEMICYNNIDLPFIVRNINNGDVITRNSKNGVYHQLVKNILTTKKISYLKRINKLVIEKDNEIIYILGLKIK